MKANAVERRACVQVRGIKRVGLWGKTAEGAHKPIILPQKDPAFYGSPIRIYNVPELLRRPVSVTQRELADALHAPAKQMKAELDPEVDLEKLADPAARDLKYEPTPSG